MALSKRSSLLISCTLNGHHKAHFPCIMQTHNSAYTQKTTSFAPILFCLATVLTICASKGQKKISQVQHHCPVSKAHKKRLTLYHRPVPSIVHIYVRVYYLHFIGNISNESQREYHAHTCILCRICSNVHSKGRPCLPPPPHFHSFDFPAG